MRNVAEDTSLAEARKGRDPKSSPVSARQQRAKTGLRKRNGRNTGNVSAFFVAVGRDTITNMKARVEHCRRLAKSMTDPRAAAILRQMAEEGEADIRKVQAEERDPSG